LAEGDCARPCDAKEALRRENQKHTQQEYDHAVNGELLASLLHPGAMCLRRRHIARDLDAREFHV
jgi:hypothetical protein